MKKSKTPYLDLLALVAAAVEGAELNDNSGNLELSIEGKVLAGVNGEGPLEEKALFMLKHLAYTGVIGMKVLAKHKGE